MAETVTTTSSDKVPEIVGLIDVVTHGSLGDRVKVVDHWRADRHAIGFRSVGRPRRLLYVSTWRQPAGRFHWELESSESGNAGATLQQGVASKRQLLTLVQRYLPDGKQRKATRRTTSARIPA
jgi:hypothetical protein